MSMRDPLIIGLTGRAGAGKDTMAAQLCEHHGFERYALAEPLRDMLTQLLTDAGIDHAWLFERPLKELPIPELGISGRRLMQTLGTGWGRGLREDFWLRLADLALGLPAAPVHDRIVITDIRFPNEAAWIAAHQGLLVRVERPVAPVAAHESEQHADTLPCWHVIDNSGTRGYLQDQVEALLHRVEALA